VLLLRGEDALRLLRRDCEFLLHSQHAVFFRDERGVLLDDFGFMRLQPKGTAHHAHSRGLHDGLLHLLEELPRAPQLSRGCHGHRRGHARWLVLALGHGHVMLARGHHRSRRHLHLRGVHPPELGVHTTKLVLLPGHHVRLARRGYRHDGHDGHLVLHPVPRLIRLQVLRRQKHAKLLRVTKHGVRRQTPEIRVQLPHPPRDEILVGGRRQRLIRPRRDEVPAVGVREPVRESHEITKPPPGDVLRRTGVLREIGPRGCSVEDNLLAERARGVGARLRVRHRRFQRTLHGALVDPR
jgi:hypothetical protein